MTVVTNLISDCITTISIIWIFNINELTIDYVLNTLSLIDHSSTGFNKCLCFSEFQFSSSRGNILVWPTRTPGSQVKACFFIQSFQMGLQLLLNNLWDDLLQGSRRELDKSKWGSLPYVWCWLLQGKNRNLRIWTELGNFSSIRSLLRTWYRWMQEASHVQGGNAKKWIKRDPIGVSNLNHNSFSFWWDTKSCMVMIWIKVGVFDSDNPRIGGLSI